MTNLIERASTVLKQQHADQVFYSGKIDSLQTKFNHQNEEIQELNQRIQDMGQEVKFHPYTDLYAQADPENSEPQSTQPTFKADYIAEIKRSKMALTKLVAVKERYEQFIELQCYIISTQKAQLQHLSACPQSVIRDLL